MSDEDPRILSLKSQLKTAGEYLKKLAKDNQRLETEVDRLTSLSDKKEDENAEMKSTIESLKKDIESIKLDQSKETSNETKDKERVVVDGLEDIKKQNEALKARIVELEESLKSSEKAKDTESDMNLSVDKALYESAIAFVKTTSDLSGAGISDSSSLTINDIYSLQEHVKTKLDLLKSVEASNKKSDIDAANLNNQLAEMSECLEECQKENERLMEKSTIDNKTIMAIVEFLKDISNSEIPKGIDGHIITSFKEAKSKFNKIMDEKVRLEQEISELSRANDQAKELRTKLDAKCNEYQSLEKEYDQLLDKLGNMKDTLSAKMRGESHELKVLREENASLHSSLENKQDALSTMRVSLEEANEQLEQLQAYSDQEINRLEELVGDLEEKLGRLQHERDLLEEQMEILRDDLNESLNNGAKWEEDREMHAQTVQNLQSALEELQQKKDLEVSMQVNKLAKELDSSNALAEQWKNKASSYEEELARLKTLETTFYKSKKQSEDQSVEVGRLRHEALVLKEHLNESMRRLREESNDFNLDKRVITNLVVSFLALPYGDSKRYEILQLMSSILQFSEEQQQKVGLVRKAGKPIPERGRKKTPDGPEYDIEIKESFSDMWISFLLRESSKASRESDKQNT
ncbi:hypothetical protein H4219_004502 [Mycoemilia scoparia]|uniref:GRIP domain-containing protein n=1 Tax=Mycoemilia scoparia TaxID=417184 RepID=A0A9W8DR16_9FUNG|nr:hypothetical protein H4219_004502 [Mycoemilia scoparia]